MVRLGSHFVRALGEPVFYLLLLNAAIVLLLPLVVQRELLARMDEERRARMWNTLTWSQAILWGGPFSMIPFAWVTRPRRGVVPGIVALAWGTLLCALLLGAEKLLDVAFQWFAK